MTPCFFFQKLFISVSILNARLNSSKSFYLSRATKSPFHTERHIEIPINFTLLRCMSIFPTAAGLKGAPLSTRTSNALYIFSFKGCARLILYIYAKKRALTSPILSLSIFQSTYFHRGLLMCIYKKKCTYTFFLSIKVYLHIVLPECVTRVVNFAAGKSIKIYI